jgi:hypothetical protein
LTISNPKIDVKEPEANEPNALSLDPVAPNRIVSPVVTAPVCTRRKVLAFVSDSINVQPVGNVVAATVAILSPGTVVKRLSKF